MINYVLKKINNPLADIKVDLGTDKPLYKYVQKAVQDIEILNILNLYRTKDEDGNDDKSVAPFIHVGNWEWHPHPLAEEIQYRRRETGTKLLTKTIGDVRIGFLDFDIYAGARDKNDRLEETFVHNRIYIPIEDDRGRYLIDNILYTEYQLVDQLLYPKGKDCMAIKSLLPVDIKFEEASETSMSGYIITSKIGMVKIFTTMEPILSCFMHIPCVLSYLEVYPILQFCGRVLDDEFDYEYFKPLPDVDIYIKAYKKGLEQFNYVRSIVVMACHIIRKHKPQNVDELRNPQWWIYQLSKYDNLLEHRGSCYEMHVGRMLDTISAQVLPIPEIDKRVMTSLLRYVLQSDFSSIDVLSYENKRLRLNEVISTIVTSVVSDKLKKMFRYGKLIKMKDMAPNLNFQPDLILKNMYRLGTVHSIDFANDLDYYQQLRMTKNGQLSAA